MTFHIFANVEDFFYEIVLGVVVTVVVTILAFLWKRAKKFVAEPVEKILKKTCERCNGSGLIVCPSCKGVGKLIRKIKEVGPCKRCGGAG